MPKKTDPQTHINFWYVVLAVMGLLVIQSSWAEASRIATVPYSEFQLMLADEAVRQVIEQSFEKASRILERNRKLLDETAATLLARETLSAADLPQVPPPTSPRRAHRRPAAVPGTSGRSQVA